MTRKALILALHLVLTTILFASPLYSQSWSQRLKDKAKQAAAAAAQNAPSSTRHPTSTDQPSTTTPSAPVNNNLVYAWCLLSLNSPNPIAPLTNVYSDVFMFDARDQPRDASQGLKSDIRWREHSREKFGSVGWNPADATCQPTFANERDALKRAVEGRQTSINMVKAPWKPLEDHWTMEGTQAYNTATGAAPPSMTAAVQPSSTASPVSHSANIHHKDRLDHWYCTSATLGKDHLYFSAPFEAYVSTSSSISKQFTDFLRSKYGYADSDAPCYGNHATNEDAQAALEKQIRYSTHPPVVKTGWTPTATP